MSGIHHTENYKTLKQDLEEALKKKLLEDFNNRYTKNSLEDSPVIKTSLIEVEWNQGCLISAKFGYHTDQIIAKYNGLCDILCNYFTEHDILKCKDNFDSFEKDKNKVLDEIERKTYKSHVVDSSNIIQKLLAYIFDIYPNNKLERADQSKVLQKEGKLDDQIFSKLLNNLNDGDYTKIGCFKKEGLSFQGHSIIFKKNGHDNYALFDPNKGVYFNLTEEELKSNLENMIKDTGCNRIAFMDNDKHVENTLGVKKQKHINI